MVDFGFDLFDSFLSSITSTLSLVSFFLIVIINLLFCFKYLEIKKLWEDRFRKKERKKKDPLLQDMKKINSLDKFILVLFIGFIVIRVIINWFSFEKRSIAFLFYTIFTNPWIILLMINITIYLIIRIYIESRKIPEKKIMVKTNITKIEYFRNICIIIGIINTCSLFFVILLCEILFMKSLTELIFIGIVTIYLFVGGCIGISLFLSHFLNLYNNFEYLGENILITSSILNKFHEVFAVLRLKVVDPEELTPINYSLFKMVSRISVEIKFEAGKLDIIYWIFQKGFNKFKIHNELKAFLDEFIFSFPSTQKIEMLNQNEIEQLIKGYNDIKLLKVKKEMELNTFNHLQNINRLDELIKSSSSLIQKTKGSIVFTFEHEKLPKKIWKRAEPSLFQVQDRKKSSNINQDRGKTDFYLADIERINSISKLEFESEEILSSLKQGTSLFKVDIYAFHEIKGLDEGTKIRLTHEMKIVLNRIFNLNAEELSFTEKLFINFKKALFRVSLSKKVFVIGVGLIKKLFQLPALASPSLKIEKKYKSLGFPNLQSNEKTIPLGLITYGAQKLYWQCPVQDLTMSLTILGQVGMGKTTLVRKILDELKSIKVNFLIFDLKGDYLDIFDSETLFLVPGKNFRINLFDPGTENKLQIIAFANLLFEQFVESLHDGQEFSPQSADLLYQAILETCKDKNKRSLIKFWETLEKLSKKYPKGQLSAVRVRINLILSGILEETFSNAYLKINDLYGLFNNNIIIDMNYFERMGGTDFQKRIFVNLILNHIYKKSMEDIDEGSNLPLRQIIVIDDGSYLVSKYDQKQGRKTYIEKIMQMSRSRGFGVIFANQITDDMPKGIMGFPANYIMFNHIDTTGDSIKVLGINNPDEQDIISSLPRFNFLVKNNQSERPFRCETIVISKNRTYNRKQMIEMTNEKINSITNKTKNEDNAIKSNFERIKNNSIGKKKKFEEKHYPKYDNIFDNSEIQLLDTYSNPYFNEKSKKDQKK